MKNCPGTLKSVAWIFSIMLFAGLFLGATAAQATTFTGTVYFTFDNGVHPNVYSQTYSYDDGTHILTLNPKTVVADTPGADGLVLSPVAGHLFVGGEGNPAVYDVKISDGTFTTITSPHNSFHLTLKPDNSTLYSSDYYTGATNGIDVIPLPGGPGVNHALTGTDKGVTQIAFAPTSLKVFYTASIPNCCANVGTIDLSAFTTTQLHSNVTGAHSILYDSFTGLMDMFGIGIISTMDQDGNNLKSSAQLDTNSDQGSVDGLGHAFIAGGNDLDFADYSVTSDITVPDQFIKNTGYTDIDDVVIVPTPPITGICPLTFGFWKTHYPGAWPSSCLPMLLGTHSYTAAQLEAILNIKGNSDASVILARQLIAAKLSICNGSDGSPVTATITDADSLIGTHTIPAHIKTSSTLGQQMTTDGAILNDFNNGLDTEGCAPLL